MSWSDSAECLGKDPKIFYPSIIDKDGVEWFDDGTIWEAYGDTADLYEQARELCSICPVRAQCLAEAQARRERFGMWGGLTPIERRRIERKDRRQRLKERRAAL